jgi:transposase-like protein
MEKTKTGFGRRRWNRKQRQGLLARFHESQFTQSEFATQHRVGLSTLSKWLRLERDGVPAKVAFQEVRLPSPVKHWPIEVVSPQGWIVRLHNGSNVQQLPELLRVLPC